MVLARKSLPPGSAPAISIENTWLLLSRSSAECHLNSLGWSDSPPQLKIGSARSARLLVIRSRIAIYVPGYAALTGIPAISKSSLSGREFPASVRKMLQSLARHNFLRHFVRRGFADVVRTTQNLPNQPNISRQRRTTGQN